MNERLEWIRTLQTVAGDLGTESLSPVVHEGWVMKKSHSKFHVGMQVF